MISGTQGISAKKIKIKKMLSYGGHQIVTAKDSVNINTLDNRGYKPHRSHVLNIKIGELSIVKFGFSILDSIIDTVVSFFKK